MAFSNDETLIGLQAETAPASDTASSGLNGRLQRIAQRLTSMLAAFPASLGAKASAASLSITLATDEPVVESTRLKVNPIAGQAGVAAGAGAVGVTVQRVVLASDDPAVVALQVLDDWDETDRAKVNLVVGQAGITGGAGASAANTPRVVLASDDPSLALRAASRLTSTRVNNAAASGDLTVVAAVAGQTTRLHRLHLSSPGTVAVQIKRGATVLDVVNLVAGANVVYPFSLDPYVVTAANEALVINASAAVQVDGMAETVTSA